MISWIEWIVLAPVMILAADVVISLAIVWLAMCWHLVKGICLAIVCMFEWFQEIKEE